MVNPTSLRGALHGERVTVTFAGRERPVLDGIDFHLELGAVRVGVTGPNGHGKTTLLRLLFGELRPDGGRVQRPWVAGRAPAAWLPQRLESDALATPLGDYVAGGQAVARALAHELAELERAMAEGGGADGLDATLERYGELQLRFEALGGYALDAQLTRVMAGLELAHLDVSRPLASLSSGERTRAALARLLLSAEPILVLDEPTNHLDVAGVRWLESFLRELARPIFVVSHDRAFLDAVADTIWHVESGSLTCFAGNWSAFEAHREAERARAMHLHAVQQKEITRLEEALRERMQWSHARERDKYGPDVFDRGYIGACAARQAKRAQAVRGRIERELEERRAEAVRVPAEVAFTLPGPASLPEVVASARGLEARVGDRVLFSGLDLDVRRGARIAIVGPNGRGKSTLLRILAGQREAQAGAVRVAGRVQVHLVEQELEGLFADARTVLDAIGAAGAHDASARTLLGCLGLSASLGVARVETLSPGERARVAIAGAVRAGAGLLLVDEPTNHLDVAAREALERAFDGWPGALVVVSHDRRFVERLRCEVIAPWGGCDEASRLA